MAIKLKMLGDNHPDLAGLYHNITILYEEQGDLDKALEYYNKSLNIRLSTVGASNADVVGGSYYSMAYGLTMKKVILKRRWNVAPSRYLS